MLKLDFIGKNVLVVGGGRGIGKACALNYADCGANIFIGNRNEEQGKSTVEEIKKMQGGHFQERGRRSAAGRRAGILRRHGGCHTA